MSRRTASIDAGWFEAQYARDPDPWRFATSAYERDKYAATLAALDGRHFESGLEVGCSIGVFTRMLAGRCTRLLALDVAETALAQARARCPGVRFAQRRVPEEWPPGRFDLILFSEVLYYLDRQAILRTAQRARAAMLPGAWMLLVHYLGETDYPCSGDEAAEAFIAASGFAVEMNVRTDKYRLDRLAATPPPPRQAAAPRG